MLKRPVFALLLMFLVSRLDAQTPIDSLELTLDSAENLFLQGNFSLLAQKYNIDAQRALVLQARLYPNPNFYISHALYSGSVKQFFPLGANDETTAGLSQLIILAGKRNKQVRLAEANTKLTEYQFYDLVRTLKYTLRTDFLNIYYLQNSSKVYDEEIKSLQQVVKAFNEQEGKGYIAEREVVRIKAQLYSLLAEYNNLVNQINDLQSELKLVLQVKTTVYIKPSIDSSRLNTLDPAAYPLTVLLDSAYENRTDLQIAKTTTNINRLNYNYQKALAVPDLSLSLGYDEQGGFGVNYYGIGAAIDLPFFNRNQGNIKSSKATIEAGNASQKSTMATVEANVYRALQKAFDNDKMYKSIDPAFSLDFDRLLKAVLDNYQKRNLTLLDFLDFYDSYKENILSSNTIRFNRVSAFEDINFYTGTDFFKY